MTYDEYKVEMREYGNIELPEKIFNICQMIEKMFNISFSYDNVEYYNRGGWRYAKAAGFSYTYCTFSMESGPDVDYRNEIEMILKGLGFEVANSHGNNGLDPAESYGRDCYWTYEFAYTKSRVYTD